MTGPFLGRDRPDASCVGVLREQLQRAQERRLIDRGVAPMEQAAGADGASPAGGPDRRAAPAIAG